MDIVDFMNRRSKGGRKEIIKLYEGILLVNGIYSKLDKSGFETCYNRYKELGGRQTFYYLGGQNGSI